MKWHFDDLDRRIYKAMKEPGHPLSTRELADAVGEDRAKVYRRLCRMQKILAEHDVSHEWMETSLVDSSRPLFFFPATGDVLTSTNHAQIDKVVGDLKGIAHTVRVPRGAQLTPEVKRTLVKKYRSYLGNMAARAPARERAHVQAFESQLMAVMSGTMLSDVLGFFGLRKFTPKERVWDLLPGAPIELPEDPPSMQNDAAFAHSQAA